MNNASQSPKTNLPPNVEEFNIIAGLIFAQLYQAFPVVVDLIDRVAIAKAMGVADDQALASGRTFNLIATYTIAWLSAEGYIRSGGAHPAERVVLATRGLGAMNAIPPGLGQPLGSALARTAREPKGPDAANRIAELMGSFAGSFTRSFTGDG